MSRAWAIAGLGSVHGAATATCVALTLLAVAPAARADDMDPALERLGAGTDCSTDSTVCVDQAGFEHLASELASATALPAMGPAATYGASTFGLALGSTITDIDQDGRYWHLGSQGSGSAGLASGSNDSPMGVLVWNRLEARKGLPFGVEIGVDVAQGMQTSFWTPGVWLKWALFEGFRERYGPLPDLALRAGFSRSVGSSQLAVQIADFELGLSRPFVVARTWSLTPFADLQLLLAHVETSVIDLTPGTDAFAACSPSAVQPPPPGVTPVEAECTGTGDDFASDVVFDALDQTRLRLAGGAEARWSFWRMRLVLHYDLLAPQLPAAKSPGLRQLAVDVALGVVL